ncbi:glycoprotein ORF-O [Elephant endotheliotropic herpesvirus 3A]|uniref:Glycoprotein ORF-O n=1 Tax=Elephant endotheliotropic herpesvirus 3A TaxID=1329409 RepID=A0A866VT76_9BETA|nr:glycoprotein ORF-O [Elephant endotheliotropic herpesvirus 3A]QOE74470.1 glycoprotein ORF-O [Elephant endotheliotropic herpesvirus 3A]
MLNLILNTLFICILTGIQSLNGESSTSLSQTSPTATKLASTTIPITSTLTTETSATPPDNTTQNTSTATIVSTTQPSNTFSGSNSISLYTEPGTGSLTSISSPVSRTNVSSVSAEHTFVNLLSNTIEGNTSAAVSVLSKNVKGSDNTSEVNTWSVHRTLESSTVPSSFSSDTTMRYSAKLSSSATVIPTRKYIQLSTTKRTKGNDDTSTGQTSFTNIKNVQYTSLYNTNQDSQTSTTHDAASFVASHMNLPSTTKPGTIFTHSTTPRSITPKSILITNKSNIMNKSFHSTVTYYNINNTSETFHPTTDGTLQPATRKTLYDTITTALVPDFGKTNYKTNLDIINTTPFELTTNITNNYTYEKILIPRSSYTSVHRVNTVRASENPNTLLSSRTLQLNTSFSDSLAASTKAQKLYLDNITECVNATDIPPTEPVTNYTENFTYKVTNTTDLYPTEISTNTSLECKNISKQQIKNITYVFDPVHSGALTSIFLTKSDPLRELFHVLDAPTVHSTEANETHTELCKHLEEAAPQDPYFTFNISFNDAQMITSLDKCVDKNYGFLYSYSPSTSWSRYSQGTFLTVISKVLQYYNLLRWLPNFQKTLDNHRCQSAYRCKYVKEEQDSHLFEIKECRRRRQQQHHVISWGLCNNYFVPTGGVKSILVSQ